MRGLSRLRIITLLIVAAILASNGLSAFLFSQLSDNQHHVARIAVWYIHGATILSIFGGIGIWMEHAVTVSIYSSFLILDAFLSTIPRICILATTTRASSDLCLPIPQDPPTFPTVSAITQSGSAVAKIPHLRPSTTDLPYQSDIEPVSSALGGRIWQSLLEQDPPPPDCQRIFALAQFTLCLAIMIAAIFQLWGAGVMRQYARKIRAQEASKAIERIYQGEGHIGDVEFGFSSSDEDLLGADNRQEDDSLRVGGGPWTLLGELAGGITRWFR